jgi:hypothetical protein
MFCGLLQNVLLLIAAIVPSTKRIYSSSEHGSSLLVAHSSVAVPAATGGRACSLRPAALAWCSWIGLLLSVALCAVSIYRRHAGYYL